MTFPITGTPALVLAVLFGAAFGALLQRGRVADYNTIVNQFRLRDFTVLKVMVTAILVGGIGVLVLQDAGAASAHIKSANMLAVVTGAALFGVGMAIYGYCPGTAVAAIGEGRIDALAGAGGMLIGGVLYAFTFDFVQAHILPVGAFGKITLSDVTGIPALAIFAVLAVAAAVGFRALEKARL
jgi:uncharacterized membrane protein YedE/YeeE